MSGSSISWAICKSAPWPRHITTPASHHSVFYRPDVLPAAQLTASKQWRPKVRNIQKMKSKLNRCKFKNCSHLWAYHCAQLAYTTQHRPVLIIFHLSLQTNLIAQFKPVYGYFHNLTLYGHFCISEFFYQYKYWKSKTFTLLHNIIQITHFSNVNALWCKTESVQEWWQSNIMVDFNNTMVYHTFNTRSNGNSKQCSVSLYHFWPYTSINLYHTWLNSYVQIADNVQQI